MLKSKLFAHENEVRVKRDTFSTVQGGIIRMGALKTSRGYNQLEVNEEGNVHFVASSSMGVIAKALEMRTGMPIEVIQVDDERGVEGVIDMVHSGIVDIGAGLFNVMEERFEKVDYSRFVGEDTFTILMKSEKHFSKADSLIAPFSRDVSLIKSA